MSTGADILKENQAQVSEAKGVVDGIVRRAQKHARVHAKRPDLNPEWFIRMIIPGVTGWGVGKAQKRVTSGFVSYRVLEPFSLGEGLVGITKGQEITATVTISEIDLSQSLRVSVKATAPKGSEIMVSELILVVTDGAITRTTGKVVVYAKSKL